jgi:lipoate-protein ligase A
MTIELITLQDTPIEKQLEIEKTLLDKETNSFILINTGPPKAIVMGSSQKEEEVIHLEKASKIPIIRRFSAGGCVILDKDTIMVTFIMNKKEVGIDLFPLSIMKWTEKFYQNCLSIPSFSLVDNDYVIGDKKVGGNAQYIKKARFLHHSSFLWDYNKEHMDVLKHPPKEPAYRKHRPHHEFLTTLKPHLSKEAFIQAISQCVLKDQIYG